MSFLSGIFNCVGVARLPVNWRPNNLADIPAIPVMLTGVPDALVKSLSRKAALKQAKWGLSEMYTINNRTESGYQFMYQGEEDPSQKPVNKALLYPVVVMRAVMQLTKEHFGLHGDHGSHARFTRQSPDSPVAFEYRDLGLVVGDW